MSNRGMRGLSQQSFIKNLPKHTSLLGLSSFFRLIYVANGFNNVFRRNPLFNLISSYKQQQIWSFTMKSPCFKHDMFIQSDPKDCEYLAIIGAHKKVDEEFDTEDAKIIVVPVEEASKEKPPLIYSSFMNLEEVLKTKCDVPQIKQRR